MRPRRASWLSLNGWCSIGTFFPKCIRFSSMRRWPLALQETCRPHRNHLAPTSQRFWCQQAPQPHLPRQWSRPAIPRQEKGWLPHCFFPYYSWSFCYRLQRCYQRSSAENSSRHWGMAPAANLRTPYPRSYRSPYWWAWQIALFG